MKFLEKLWGKGEPSFVPETCDRDTVDAAASLSPEKVARIMRQALSGDIKDQCRLARELPEHNIEIAQALQTRVDAALGCRWRFCPGDDSNEAKAAAEALEKELAALGNQNEADTFDELLEDMMGALLPGFAISEILWVNGGHIAGFNSIEQQHFTLTGSYFPQLVTSEYPAGLEIPRNHIIYHKMRFHGKDPARGGLIRPLAWIHCFMNSTDKNLLSFVERYGMPFLVVKADEQTYQKERRNIKELIRSFGSSGGGLFSKNTEAELLQAASVNGDIYFRLRDALRGSITRLILGQTASSGDGGGLSDDGAQDKVRRDLLKSDCRKLQRTINAQLCVPWARFNYGASVAAPRFEIDCGEPEDMLALAQMLQALKGAGLDADPEEMSERFGIQLVKSAPVQPAPAAGYQGFADTGKEQDEAPLPDALEKWLGPVADKVARVVDADDEDFDDALKNLAGSELPGAAADAENLMRQDMQKEFDEAKK